MSLASRRARKWAPWFLTPLTLCFLVACGKGEVGDECGDPGDPDECEDGTICTNEGEGDSAVCRALCEEQEDCPSGESCNGVSETNLKSCQPDKDK